jgi:hypothetical protein
MLETKKAFRKLNKNEDLHGAVTVLCNLKGVGPAMASGIECCNVNEDGSHGRVQGEKEQQGVVGGPLVASRLSSITMKQL